MIMTLFWAWNGRMAICMDCEAIHDNDLIPGMERPNGIDIIIYIRGRDYRGQPVCFVCGKNPADERGTCI